MGMLAQEAPDFHATYEDWFKEIALDLYRNELRYAEELYDDIGLTEKVKIFIRHNFNVACDNLGFDRLFDDEEVDPIVINGLKLSEGGRGTHDFFSVKGSGYSKLPIEHSQDEDFADIPSF